MTTIAKFATSFFALVGLVCATFALAFFALAFTGHGDQIAKVSCAVRTDGVAEYTSCMYSARANIDD